jgi:hypothetical protein
VSLPDDKRDVVNAGLVNDQKKPDDQDDSDFLVTARKRFQRALSAEAINRKDAIDDLLFKNGQQWPDNIRTDRVQQKRPCLTINKMKTFVHQVTNNMRQNRPAINISPVGDKADKNTAQMLKGLIRQIERQSSAEIAYDTGFDSAVSNGWGYWRLLTDYEDDKSFNQVIKVVPIRNPLRVYLDPDSQMPDGSDAKWGFISDLIPREEFKELYPNADLIPWEQGGLGDDSLKEWSTDTHIRIAEYLCFKTNKRRLISVAALGLGELAKGYQGFEDEAPEQVQELLKDKALREQLVENEREVEAQQVHWSKITAHQVLEEIEWPGMYLPIVKVSGDVVDVEGKATYAGLIRDAKDPQRMKNYWATAKTELVALAPKAPYIVEEGQVEGHEKQWQMANQKSYSYLPYKGTSIAGKPAPAPRREPFAGAPAGVIEAEQSAEQDMMATTGVRFDATKSERIPEESGKALRELKFLGELGSFHYTANLVHALKYTARQLIDLIPKIYDARRVVTILREDDTEEQVTIEPGLAVPFQTRPGAKGVEKLYNPGLGKYDVAISIGPNFQTKRSEAAEGMLGFMKAVGPDAARVAAGPMARNMDWPGSEEIADRMDAMLPPQVLQKGLEQLGEVPPKAKALIGSLQFQLQQAQQQMQQMGQELQTNRAELDVKVRKGDQDYDAKMTKIAADLKMHVEQLIAQRLGAREQMEKEGFEAGRDQHNRDADREEARRAELAGSEA